MLAEPPAIIRTPTAPKSYKLPPANDKAPRPATPQQLEEANRMASALTSMKQKDAPEIKKRIPGSGENLSSQRL